MWPGCRALKAANSAASHDSASEHPASGQGMSPFFFGAEDLGGLGHEVHSGEEDDVGIDRLRLHRQGERVAQEVCDGLHLGSRVVVGQDHSFFLPFEVPDAAGECGGVFDVHFLFLFL